MTKDLKRAVGCGIAVLVVGAVGFSGCSLLLAQFRDEHFVDLPNPPDDSDLVVHPLDLPDDENAYLYYVRAAQSVYWTADQDEQVRGLRDGDEWDPEFAEAFLAQNQKAWNLYQKGLACEWAQGPLDDPEDERFALETHENEGLRALVVARLRTLMARGEEEAAFDEAFDLVEYGHTLKACQGATIHSLHGASLQAIALDTLRGLLPHTTLPAAQLAAYAQQLEKYKHDEDAVADVFRGEHAAAIRMMTQDPSMARVVQQNRMRARLAEATRKAIESAGKPYAEADLVEVEDRGTLGFALDVLSRNVMGSFLYDMHVGMLPGLFGGVCRRRSEMSATQVLLALRAYHLDTGSLPESLEELVPDYLAEIPLDYFDGKPIKYSPSKKLVYSVGYDLVDAGGWEDTSGKTGQMGEPSWAIEF